MFGNSWVAAQLAASQEELSSMELIRYFIVTIIVIIIVTLFLQGLLYT
jgi:hypothetical protein